MPKSDEQKKVDNKNFADGYRDDQREKIANGENLCATARCKDPPVEGKTKCQYHIDYDRARMKIYRAKKKQERAKIKEWNKENPNEKKCAYCPRPNDTDGDMCSVCLEKTRKAYAEEKRLKEDYNLENPDARVCTAYGCDQIIFDEGKLCFDCREDAKEDRKKDKKKREEKQKKDGRTVKICSRCKHYVDSDVHKICKERRREYYRQSTLILLEYNQLHPEDKRCHRCRKPNDTEFHYCKECREKEASQKTNRKTTLRASTKKNLCCSCNHPNDSADFSQCSKCRENQRLLYNKRKEESKEYNGAHTDSKMCCHCGNIYTKSLDRQLCPKCDSFKYSDVAIIREIRRGASKRNKVFEPTNEEVLQYARSDCYYCGSKAEDNKRNGIDRKDNNIDYLKTNIVPCCSTCNRIKYTTHIDKFYQVCLHIASIHSYVGLDAKYFNTELFECAKFLGFKKQFETCRKGAETRTNSDGKRLKFELDFDDYCKMITDKCYYCHKEPNIEKGLCNGIDRAFNNFGYIKGNCIPCCKYCNMHKAQYDCDIYINRCIKIAKRYLGFSGDD